MDPTPRLNNDTTCCTELDAWAWVEAVTEQALVGDEDARRVLPNVIEHWLQVVAR